MIGDLSARVLVHFEGETKDLKAAIRDLTGEEKKLAEAQLKQANARNEQLDKWLKGLGTATVAIGAAAAAGAAMWAGMEHNARKAQLALNVNAASVERLRKGMGGLRTEMQALEAANTLSNSKFKLTGEQMETVGKAMRQLVREGHDWEDVTTKVADAFLKLNGGGLDDFGIHVKDAKTEAGKFNAILESMAAKAGKVGDGTKTSAEELQALRVRFTDVMDRVKASLGEIGTAFLPIVEALAQIAGYASQLTGMIPGGAGTIGKVAKYGIPVYGQYFAVKDLFFGDKGKLGSLNVQMPGQSNVNGLNSQAAKVFDMLGDALAYVSNDPWRHAALGAGKGGRARKPTMPGYQLGATEYGTSGGGYFDGFSGYTDISAGIGSERFAELAADRETAMQQAYNAYGQSKLEGIFGPLSDFDAYKTAFETLNGAVGSAFGAWIDGSQSAGEAFKKFIGEALKGVAVQMAMESVKHAAYAIGSLAYGNLAGAATHGKAAAAFAAGAIVVGAAAKKLHSGGGDQPSASGGASPGGGVSSYSGGSQQNGGGSSTVVVFGNDYTMDSPRQRQLRAARALEEARQVSGNGAVSYA